jgi:mono/diheme cytochrome c family protein
MRSVTAAPSAFVTLLLGALFLVWLMAMGATAAVPGQAGSSLIVTPLAGKELFGFYCASCHGSDGKGNGRVARALKTPPADLTLISRRNNGTFPRQRVVSAVTGSTEPVTPAHGTKDMPVWGPIFQAIDTHDRQSGVRIANVVDYIESIQQK